MRWRMIIVASLLLNLLLAAGWVWSSRQWESRFIRITSRPEGEAPSVVLKTNFVVRKQFFTWAELEADDYRKYVANLRNIGCPEQTIRDIIIADVNSMFARRRAMEIVTASQQWWRAEPDTNVVAKARAQTEEMEDERRLLLADLLGGDWESGDQLNLPRPTRAGVALDGAMLGMLPQEVKSSVEDITNRGADRAQDYVEAQRAAGKPVDQAELARIRQQTRAELAATLTPPQLEEFLLRYSENAGTLRTELGKLKYFNATPDEFRQMFRATDTLDNQLQLLAGATDIASVQQRVSLMSQRENALRLALGQDRYTQYRLMHEPAFQDAYASAQKAGNAESAPVIYEINTLAAEEQARIKANTNLTAEQRAIETKRTELEQLKATARAMGQTVANEPTQTQPQQNQPILKTHTLLGLEDLNVLSRLYNINADQIRAANPDVNFNRLRPGDRLNIPLVNPLTGGREQIQRGNTAVPPPPAGRQ